MRGDRPVKILLADKANMATPHARGSTWIEVYRGVIAPGYPACAGIDPFDFQVGRVLNWLPRMRGDRPLNINFSGLPAGATPHARGSTHVNTNIIYSKGATPHARGSTASGRVR